MSVVYNGAHAITFTKLYESGVDDNTWPLGFEGKNGEWHLSTSTVDTWYAMHLIPVSRPFVVTPEPRVQFVTIPRSNRILDLTNALTPDVTYEAREGDWEFYIDHDQWNSWSEAYDTISEWLDGSLFDVTLTYEAGYTMYHGRVYVSNYTPDNNYSKITIHYLLDAESTVHDWVIDLNSYDNRFTTTFDIDNSRPYYRCTSRINFIVDEPKSFRVTLSGYGVSSENEYYVVVDINNSTFLKYEITDCTFEGGTMIGTVEFSDPITYFRIATKRSSHTNISCKFDHLVEETVIF